MSKLLLAVALLCLVPSALAFDFPTIKICTTKPEDLPICTAGQIPTYSTTTGCMSCRLGSLLPAGCTLAKIAACVTSSLTPCADGVEPVRDDVSCCPSCIKVKLPPLLDCALRTNPLVVQCAQNFMSLPVCAAGTTPAFNSTACCATCRIQPPAILPDCTRDQFSTCITNMPVCAADQLPTFDHTKQCCPSCKPASLSCTLEDVVQCRKAQPVCASNERPSLVQGECCMSCKPALPSLTCTPACATTERCVFKFANENNHTAIGTHCVAKKDLHLRFKAIADAVKNATKAWDVPSWNKFLNEVVRRFCSDKTDQIAFCKRVMDGDQDVADFAVTAATPNTDGSTDVTVSSSDASVAAGSTTARLFPIRATVTASTVAGVVTQASSDSYATAGYSATTPDTAASAAFAHVPNLFVVAALALLVFIF